MTMIIDGTNGVTFNDSTLVKSGSVAVVGTVRNAKMYVSTASTSATFTADEIILETALGGTFYKLANYSQVINLATTGAGGMDTGSAPTAANAFVALYAIYNPTTLTASILATNASSGVAPNIYGGANMPSGYTASALISVWHCNGSGQLVVGMQRDRRISIASTTALTTSTVPGTYTSLALGNMVPFNGLSVFGILYVSNTSASSTAFYVATDSNGINGFSIQFAEGAATNYAGQCNFPDMFINTAQTIYYYGSVSAGTPTISISIAGYTI